MRINLVTIYRILWSSQISLGCKILHFAQYAFALLDI